VADKITREREGKMRATGQMPPQQTIADTPSKVPIDSHDNPIESKDDPGRDYEYEKVLYSDSSDN